MRAADAIWDIITFAQAAHGDAAETFARREALNAEAKGDAELAATWQSAAEQLHTLHTINRHGSGMGQDPLQETDAEAP